MSTPTTPAQDNGVIAETATGIGAPTEGLTGVRRSIVHVSLSVRGAIDWPDRLLRGLVSDENGDRLKPREAREWLKDQLSQGIEMLSMGECDNFDPKTGCRGHTPVGLSVGAPPDASVCDADVPNGERSADVTGGGV